MTSNLYLLFIFGSLSSFLVAAVPTATTSYIQQLNVSYIEGKWICDGNECPAETFGCRVLRKTDAKENWKLDEESSCFDEQKRNIHAFINTIEMPSARHIDIDVQSYIGAVSVFSTGYGVDGDEDAHGIIAPNDWDHFKNSSAINKNRVETGSQ